MKKQIVYVFIAIALAFLCFIKLDHIYNKLNKETLNYVFEDTSKELKDSIDFDGPKIDSVYPLKCEEYIIGTPTIEAHYKDDSNINLESIKLFVNYIDVTSKCNITDNKISYTPEKKFKRGNQIVKLTISDSLNNITELEWYFTVGTPIYKHYRGLLHSHTSASDGHGSYNDAYYMARDKAFLDFFAITDHSNLLDNHQLCNLDNAKASNKWNELIMSRDRFTKNNEFIGLNGFEMTYDYNIDNPVGHINVLNSDGFITAGSPELSLDNFYSMLSNYDNLIGQFNHPCEKFGYFNNFKYSSKGDKALCLLEVNNGYNEDHSKNIHSYDFYQLALDKGWHVAPTCNQDNHRVDFGIANEYRTVVLATDLTRDNIYDSLKNMRVYATEDKNLRIDYTINDLPMGCELENPTKLRFSISAIDNDSKDKIKKIEVISNNGKIIKQKSFNSNLAKLEFSLIPKTNAFYYVKVIQDNDKTSVTAPIWINGDGS